MRWREMTDQRGPAGLLTPLALALDAIEDNGCDCGTDEPGTCLACRCEAALKDLWEQTGPHAALLLWLDTEIEATRKPGQMNIRRTWQMATRSALERVKARLCG